MKKTKEKECNHCLHTYRQYTSFGTHVIEICCWCGKRKDYDIPNSTETYSMYDLSKHGPFAQTTIMMR